MLTKWLCWSKSQGVQFILWAPLMSSSFPSEPAGGVKSKVWTSPSVGFWGPWCLYKKMQGNPSNNCQDISVWAKVVDRQNISQSVLLLTVTITLQRSL